MVGGGQVKIKGKKAQVQITLSPELLEKARKYGLNVSKIAENALKSYIERLEGNKTETNRETPLFGEAFSAKRFCGAPAGIWTRVSGSKGRNT
jgi:post-segregation antitoxin (ccd killing protein)